MAGRARPRQVTASINACIARSAGLDGARIASSGTEGEVVVFAWIEWPSKEASNAGMARIRDDPRMQAMRMPFDGMRLIYGGFAKLLDG